MPASIFNGDAIKLLKAKLRFKDSNVQIITNDTDDPTVVPKDAPQGSLYIRSGTGVLYVKTDSGSSTNWNAVADSATIADLVTGPVSATDNALVRFDGTTGKLTQNSLGILSDAGALSALTQLSVDNLDLNGNTLSATDTNGSLNLAANGTGQINATSRLFLSTDGTASLEAVTKQQLDAVTSGVEVKAAAHVATLTDITLSGEQTIDGHPVVSGERVLVKNQSSDIDNGIYVVSTGAWSRAADADTGPELVGALVTIQQGGQANTGWYQTTPSPIVIGVSSIIWTQFFGAGTYTASGQGIVLNTSTFSFQIDGSTLSQSGSGAKVATGGITNTEVNATAGIVYSKLSLGNSIVNTDINSSAAIALTKLAALSSHNRALVSDTSGFIAESSVTSTELGYVSGVTSAIQTQLGAKASTSLNNLSSTAINADLIPATDITNNLGSAAATWQIGYAYELRAQDENTSINVHDRLLADSGGNPMFQWYGPNLDANSHLINNVLDPVDPQDAATKAYVDTFASGANTALSNLTTTSVNQDLLPDSNTTKNLGSAALTWQIAYTYELRSQTTSTSINVNDRVLNDSLGDAALNWYTSGLLTLSANFISDSDNTRDLGSNTIGFTNTYTYFVQAPFTSPAIDLANGFLNDSDGNNSVAWEDRVLRDSSNNPVLGWGSGTLDANTHKISSVVDPTDLQDAATKNYVDNTVAVSAGNTNSINMTDTLNVFTADLNLSSAAAGSGLLNSVSSIETDGLHVRTKSTSTTIDNLIISPSMASNAMTVDIKQFNNTDPSSGSGAITVAFRSSSSATGSYSLVQITGALGMTVSSGSTLGLVDGQRQYTYVYLINNAGTAEVAISGTLFDDGSIVSTTAEGGAGAADTLNVMYSTTARSNVACRLIGRLLTNLTTAGTWTGGTVETSLAPFNSKAIRNSVTPVLYKDSVEVDTCLSGNTHGSTNTAVKRWTNTNVNTGNSIIYADSATLGGSWTIKTAGIYSVSYTDGGSATAGQNMCAISVNSTVVTSDFLSSTYAQGRRAVSFANAGSAYCSCSWTGYLDVGDVVRAQDRTTNTNSSVNQTFTIVKVA